MTQARALGRWNPYRKGLAAGIRLACASLLTVTQAGVAAASEHFDKIKKVDTSGISSAPTASAERGRFRSATCGIPIAEDFAFDMCRLHTRAF